MENVAVLLMIILGVLLIGLAAIWRELRMINSPERDPRWGERALLPMSSGVKVPRNESSMITGRVDHTFNPQRVFISNAGTAGGAADWVVNDIRIAGKTIFAQPGDIPGDLFTTRTEVLDRFLTLRSIEPGQSVQIIVTYIGTAEEGVPFFAGVDGTLSPKKLWRNKPHDKAAVLPQRS